MEEKPEEQKKQKIKLTLRMSHVVLEGANSQVDAVEISCVEEKTEEETLTLSKQWLRDQDFLKNHIIGLKKFGESSLTIEPVEPLEG